MQKAGSDANHPVDDELAGQPGSRRSGKNAPRIRRDTRTATAVNKGLAAALLSDLPAGYKVMSDAGVPTSVIMRVFLKPDQRRASDWKHQ